MVAWAVEGEEDYGGGEGRGSGDVGEFDLGSWEVGVRWGEVEGWHCGDS